MDSNITCRPARAEDIPTLLSFEQGIVSYERPYNSSLAPDPISYYDIAAMIGTDGVEVVVAEIGDRLIGSGYAKRKRVADYYDHDEVSYLGFMFVDPEFRGRGVNKLIVDWLLDWSRQQGLTEIRLDVYSENDAALRAYQKAGFKPLLTEMRLKLD